MPEPPSARLGIVVPETDDAADGPAFFAHIRDRLEATVAILADARLGAVVPVGAGIPWYGTGDPAAINGATFLLADGRLIDKTTFAAFFAAVGHVHNGGVDPGSNKVRIPDLRGRAPVGADDMGTVAGAAGRLPNSNRALGQSGGEERHTLTGVPRGADGWVSTQFGTGIGFTSASGLTQLYETPGSAGSPHNNMQPYYVENVLVRVA